MKNTEAEHSFGELVLLREESRSRLVLWRGSSSRHCSYRVPPILAYANLIATLDPRNIEVAKLIREQHIDDAFHQALITTGFSRSRRDARVDARWMRMFGVLDLETAFDGCRFAIGIRNATISRCVSELTRLRVLVWSNLAFQADFALGTIFTKAGTARVVLAMYRWEREPDYKSAKGFTTRTVP
jgi:hypothetical protein